MTKVLILAFILLPWNLLFSSEDLYKKSEQLILVLNDERKKETTMHFYEMQEAEWKEVLHPVSIAIGRTGLLSQSEKREGDGATPKGEYPLVRSYGYSSLPGLKFFYEQNSSKHFWVDDIHSNLYNQRVKGKPKTKSYHPLLRKDKLYKYIIVIEYNTNPAESGKGSMIFIHPWDDPAKPTSGCLGAKEEDVREILHWLRKDKNPILVIESVSQG